MRQQVVAVYVLKATGEYFADAVYGPPEIHKGGTLVACVEDVDSFAGDVCVNQAWEAARVLIKRLKAKPVAASKVGSEK